MIRAIVTAAILTFGAAQLVHADEQVLAVSPDVITFYKGEYQGLQPPRAIAVSADGRHFGYSYCPEHRCYIIPSARDLALQACGKAGGWGCRIFAVDDDIKISYRVMGLSDLSPPPGPTSPPPGAAKTTLLTWTEADVRTCFGAPKDSDVVAGWPRYRFKRGACTAYIMFHDGKVHSVEGYGSEPECWRVVEACKN
jgi:hypothetical protein